MISTPPNICRSRIIQIKFSGSIKFDLLLNFYFVELFLKILRCIMLNMQFQCVYSLSLEKKEMRSNENENKTEPGSEMYLMTITSQ